MGLVASRVAGRDRRTATRGPLARGLNRGGAPRRCASGLVVPRERLVMAPSREARSGPSPPEAGTPRPASTAGTGTRGAGTALSLTVLKKDVVNPTIQSEVLRNTTYFLRPNSPKTTISGRPYTIGYSGLPANSGLFEKPVAYGHSCGPRASRIEDSQVPRPTRRAQLGTNSPGKRLVGGI